MKRALFLGSLLATGLVPATAAAQAFTYDPVGQLVSGSGTGREDQQVYAPGMRFPIENGPAFANSQVYGHGGYLGPGGGQCDEGNYSYPWQDNYCETRQWDMPLCPAGNGHQGQDIRPGTCDDNTHWGVATTDGVITNVGSYSVYLTADDGTRYDFLHMSNVQVSVGQEVKRGDRLGYVSNEFGGTATTIHLHFNIRQSVQGLGSVYVPPYTSLISAYQKLIDAPATGALESAACGGIRGWAFDPSDPEVSPTVTLRFGVDGTAEEQTVLADSPRDDLCENLGFCDRGFTPGAPLSLFDGRSYSVQAFVDGAQLDGDDVTLACEAPELEGVLRSLGSGDAAEDAAGAWRLSRFWDAPPAGEVEDQVASLSEGEDWPQTPSLVQDDLGNLYLDEGDLLRPLDLATARAWRLEPAMAGTFNPEVPIGAPLPLRPVLLEKDGELFVLDKPLRAGTGSGGANGVDDDGVDPGTIDDGCSCRTAAAPRSNAPAWLWVLGLVGLARRRRR